jgi:hypothetical protein
VKLSPLGTSATVWPIVLAPDDDECEAVGGMAGETEVLEENLPQCCCVFHKPHMAWPGLLPGTPQWEASD